MFVSTWSQDAKALGCQITDEFGLRADCPFCRTGQVNFYSDGHFGGKRFSAPCCSQAGDLADLVAQINGLSRDKALLLIARAAPDYDQSLNQTSHHKACQTNLQFINEIWDTAVGLSEAYNQGNFSTFLTTHKLDFSSGNSWHAENIDNQFRYLTAEQFAELGENGRLVNVTSEMQDPINHSITGGAIVTRFYGLPGQVSGLLYFVAEGHALTPCLQVVDPVTQDTGLSLHPLLSLDLQQLAVTDDLDWYLRCHFYYADKIRQPLPLAAMINWPFIQPQSAQPLVTRPSVFWISRLTPHSLRVAARLNSLITSYGASTGFFSSDCLSHLASSQFVEDLKSHAAPWQNYVADAATTIPFGELQYTIHSADLTETQVDKLKAELTGDSIQLISRADIDKCPPNQINTSRGVVEQTPEGWVWYNRGLEECICNKSWRIKRLIETDSTKPEQTTCVVEIFEYGKWVSVPCNQNELTTNTLATLEAACNENRPMTITASPLWESSLMDIAEQLNPIGRPINQFTCGIDRSNAKLHTSNYEISIINGELYRPATRPLLDLMPEADDRLPNASSVAAAIKHPLTIRTLSAAALQLLTKCHGNPQVSVCISSTTSGIVHHILDSAGLLGFNIPNELETPALCMHNLNTSPKTLLATDASGWLPAFTRAANWLGGVPPVANWLAAYKPTIYLGNNSTEPRTYLEIPAIEFQRIIFQLLTRSLADISHGVDAYRAISNAWAAIGIDASSMPLQRMLPRPTPISKAVGYWVSWLVKTGDLDVLKGDPQKLTEHAVWLDRNPKYFWVTRDSINVAITATRLPAWRFSTIAPRLLADSGFKGRKRRDGQVLWKLKLSVLTPAIRRKLLGRKRSSIRFPVA